MQLPTPTAASDPVTIEKHELNPPVKQGDLISLQGRVPATIRTLTKEKVVLAFDLHAGLRLRGTFVGTEITFNGILYRVEKVAGKRAYMGAVKDGEENTQSK